MRTFKSLIINSSKYNEYIYIDTLRKSTEIRKKKPNL